MQTLSFVRTNLHRRWPVKTLYMQQNSVTDVSVSDLLGGVYMRKLAPARVSYRDDFLISYRVYMMTGLFHISLFEGTLHVDRMHV